MVIASCCSQLQLYVWFIWKYTSISLLVSYKATIYCIYQFLSRDFPWSSCRQLGGYRIAVNFRGRKLSQIGEKYMIFAEKTFTNCSLLPRQRTPRPQISRRKLLQLATKLRNSRTFSLSKVSHYTILPLCHYVDHEEILTLLRKQTNKQTNKHNIASVCYVSKCNIGEDNTWLFCCGHM